LSQTLDTHTREAALSDTGETKAIKGLSVDEALGELFVINSAGHDITANLLDFTLLLLTAHTEV
jgi:cytochrome P450